MRNKILLFLAIIFQCFSCQNKSASDDQITELTFLRLRDTSSQLIHESRYFIFSENLSEVERTQLVADFVKKIPDSILNSIDDLGLLFYKKSKYTNEKHLKANIRDIDRYSWDHDLAFRYSWDKKFKKMTRFLIKNGEILNGNKVTVTDIKE